MYGFRPPSCPSFTFLRQPALAVVLLLCSSSAAAGGPKVVVSIQPVHALVSGIMQGVAVPHLLVAGRASPHGYQMRPSDAAALYAADLVFWMGVPLENFLQDALKNIRPPSRIVRLLDTPGLELLANRQSGVWAIGGGSGHGDNIISSVGNDPTRDPHVWLSPANARRLVEYITITLTQIDPVNASRYADNARALAMRIDSTRSRIDMLLGPVRKVPFVMFHDAFQYFEAAFDLRAAGALHLEPDRPPGARRIRDLRTAIRRRGIRCVFREPQFEAALVETLIEGTDAKVGVVDPLGATFRPGPDAWFRMMEANAEAMAACLGIRE